MKNYLIIALMLCIGLLGRAEELTVGLAGNAYVVNARSGAQISGDGLEHCNNAESVVRVYLYLHQPQKVELSLLAKGHSQIKVSYGKQTFNVNLQSRDFATVPVGTIDVRKPGYVRIDLQGVSKIGRSFGDVKQLIVGNAEGRSSYVDDFSDYWARRCPPVHLAYTLL